MRLVLADDAALLRAGLVGLLERAGHEVSAELEDGPSLVDAVMELAPPARYPTW